MNPTTCGHCDVALVPRDSNELTVRHRAFEALVVTVDGLQVCPSCEEIYTPVGYDAAIDKAYAAKLREHIPVLWEKVKTQGVRPVKLERMLGLDAGEVRKVLVSEDTSPAVTKVLASILVTMYLLLQSGSSEDMPQGFADYLKG